MFRNKEVRQTRAPAAASTENNQENGEPANPLQVKRLDLFTLANQRLRRVVSGIHKPIRCKYCEEKNYLSKEPC